MTATRCRQCEQDLPQGFAFCTRCGTPVGQNCAHCGFANPGDARFCGGCGRPDPFVNAGSIRTEAELRQLTVMFCDLVGSTELSQRLDPEELRDAIRAYQQYCGSLIAELEGHIAQYLGDGLLVYFGYPQAHEDDPSRALRAALTIVDGLPELNSRLGRSLPQLRSCPLDVRVGVHTGPVVVGEMGDASHREELALGDTVNIAARLQGLGQPGWITLSERTARRVQDQFVLERLGPRALRGVSEPVVTYRAIEPAGKRSRSDQVERESPFLGRDAELARLLELWELAKAGRGQAIVLRGEAGIGKSRLIAAFRQAIHGAPHAWLECACSAMHMNSALFPVIEFMRDGLGLETDAAASEIALQRLAQYLHRAGLAPDETLPLLMPLLGLERPETGPQLSPEAQRRRTREALTQWLLHAAMIHPFVVVLEDLQWIDPSSRELLELMIERAAHAPVLLIGTERQEHPLELPSRVHSLQLQPLSSSETEQMVRQLAAKHALPPEILRQVTARTDGVPLFVEELTKSVLESEWFTHADASQRRSQPLQGIPSTLQDSLMARLDRLPRGKEIAQLASVIGREFSHLLLMAVAPHDEVSLDLAIDELIEAELIYERGEAPNSVYVFKHALVQDVAYQSMLKRRRRELHQRIAETLESRFSELAKLQPEILAYHFECAQITERAVDFYEDAARQATERSAVAEAITYLRRAIELCNEREAFPSAREQSCRLHLALGTRITELRGFGEPETEKVFRRAIELCGERPSESPEYFQARWALSIFYQARARLAEAIELAECLVASAEHMGDPSLELMACQGLGSALLWSGRFAEAQRYIDRAVTLYRPDEHRRLAYSFGEDPGVSTRVYSAFLNWFRGRPDHSLRVIHQAVSIGEESGHPFSLAYAHSLLAVIHALRHERELTQQAAHQALLVAESQDLELWKLIAGFLLIWADTPAGSPPERVQALQQSMGTMSTVGTEVISTLFLAWMADALRNSGQLEAARGIVLAGLQFAEERKTPFWLGELLRMQGELEIALDPEAREAAEACFMRAYEVSERQGAVLLALRAATAWASLPATPATADRARERLSAQLDALTEGTQLADVKRARAALEKLG